jgi:hypothetical protein
LGVKAGQPLNDLLLSNLPKINKVAILIHAYGFKESEANEMVPDTVNTEDNTEGKAA